MNLVELMNKHGLILSPEEIAECQENDIMANTVDSYGANGSRRY